MHNYKIEIKKHSQAVHHFINTTGSPLTGMITKASLILTNQFLPGLNKTLKAWRKEQQMWNVNFEFPPGQPKSSKPINYLVISNYIRENGFFDPYALDLPDLSCGWLDGSAEIQQDFYFSGKNDQLGISSGDLQTHHFGQSYPIKPALNREGTLFTNINSKLVLRMVKKRKELINSSDKVFDDDWIFDLRNLISDAVSLIDITLNQIYVKAQFDPLPNWTFDLTKLKERHGRRLNDKLAWVRMITGKNLDIEKYKPSLETIRELRNHFMHFDPPTLVVTWEEATEWLNQIIDIGHILIAIRQTLNVDISPDLINFILQEEAIFQPIDNSRRHAIKKNGSENYYSSTWQS